MFFLKRLQSRVLKLVDVSYGGENGFNQVKFEVLVYCFLGGWKIDFAYLLFVFCFFKAIELASEVLANVKFIQEKKLIGKGIFKVWNWKQIAFIQFIFICLSK